MNSRDARGLSGRPSELSQNWSRGKVDALSTNGAKTEGKIIEKEIHAPAIGR
jgi:hypothetical protein